MFTSDDVLKGLGQRLRHAVVPEELRFAGAAVDSRKTHAGDLFFALKGERTDGNLFVEDALSHGAIGVVVSDPAIEVPDDIARFEVDDTLLALQDIARHKRDSLPNMRVIGVTGSVGKTSTKEVIAHVLGRKFNVVKNVGSLNSESGLPMTLLGIESAPEKAVLEMAMYVPGDIGLLCSIARPQIGVVTNVGVSHMARAGSLEAIVNAKAELPESLPPDGVAVLNYDDTNVRGMAGRTSARVITYGLSAEADVRATDVLSHGLNGQRFTLVHGKESIEVTTPVIGRHRLPNLLAAAAVALAEGMTLQEIADVLKESHEEVRLRVVKGINGSTIIDDTYNASPASVIGALQLLSEMPGRRLALLGDMRELGEVEVAAHQEVGRHAAKSCDVLLVAGELGKMIGEAARAAGLEQVRTCENLDAAVQELRNELSEGDYLLAKASRAMEFDVAVARLSELRDTA